MFVIPGKSIGARGAGKSISHATRWRGLSEWKYLRPGHTAEPRQGLIIKRLFAPLGFLPNPQQEFFQIERRRIKTKLL